MVRGLGVILDRMAGMRIFQLAVPRENEYTPEAAASIFSSMAHLRRPSWVQRWIHQEHGVRVALETVVVGQKVHFFGAVSPELGDYFAGQFQAAYPLAIVSEQEDYLEDWQELSLEVGQMAQSTTFYYPVKTYKEFSDIDPMVSLLGVMSKARADEVMIFQMVLTGAGERWRQQAFRDAQGIPQKDGTVVPLPGKALVEAKASENGFWTCLRLASNDGGSLEAMSRAFGVLNRGDGNGLVLRRPILHQKRSMLNGLFERSLAVTSGTQVLTVSELATIWHMPSKEVKVQNLTWAKNLETEAPDNLPAAMFLTAEQKQEVTFFARTNFKGEDAVFGIKKDDRTRHMYIIGKSGVGKSTLLENMAVDDMKKGEGIAFLDPHGSSVENLLNYIPKRRINEVIYFDPADTQYPIPLNILEVVEPGQREFVASGIVSIFAKLYAYSWGPRLEYVLRNTLLTLTEYPGATLPNIIDILTNKNFRDKVMPSVTDPVMQKFWKTEFNRWDQRQQTEAVAPILNKVGQFVSSPLIRRIISHKKSSIDFEQIMDEGKILLVNLSQGRMGEDNAALMGAMMITKIQLAAMRRAGKSPDKYKDFYLYVDEFQNFATQSFIKILSEARKYRLGLILANQYVEQIGEEIMAAVRGNAGTLINFLVGSEDAKRLVDEYGGLFTKEDLVGLGRGEVIVKLAIDGLTSRAFFAKTLPPAKSTNQNRDKVIKVSRERWGKKATESPKSQISNLKPQNVEKQDEEKEQGRERKGEAGDRGRETEGGEEDGVKRREGEEREDGEKPEAEVEGRERKGERGRGTSDKYKEGSNRGKDAGEQRKNGARKEHLRQHGSKADKYGKRKQVHGGEKGSSAQVQTQGGGSQAQKQDQGEGRKEPEVQGRVDEARRGEPMSGRQLPKDVMKELEEKVKAAQERMEKRNG